LPVLVRGAVSVTFFKVARGLALATLAPACLVATTNEPREETADTTPPPLREMAERYATCVSYEDTGMLTVTNRDDNGPEHGPDHIQFETLFDRARGGFRFDFSQVYARFVDPHRAAIWRHSPGLVHTWWSLKHRAPDQELASAIDEFGGISLRTSRNVPMMLFGWAPNPYRELVFQIDGDETVRDAPCVKLSARQEDRLVIMWIGKRDHALRKLFERWHNDGLPLDATVIANLPEEVRNKLAQVPRTPAPFTTELSTEYNPVFDRSVDPSRFEFTPPPSPPSSSP